jgi:hypothetical protein
MALPRNKSRIKASEGLFIEPVAFQAVNFDAWVERTDPLIKAERFFTRRFWPETLLARQVTRGRM